MNSCQFRQNKQIYILFSEVGQTNKWLLVNEESTAFRKIFSFDTGCLFILTLRKLRVPILRAGEYPRSNTPVVPHQQVPRLSVFGGGVLSPCINHIMFEKTRHLHTNMSKGGHYNLNYIRFLKMEILLRSLCTKIGALSKPMFPIFSKLPKVVAPPLLKWVFVALYDNTLRRDHDMC